MQNEQFCKKCGHLLGEGVGFCGNCGEKVEVIVEERENYLSWHWRLTYGFFAMIALCLLVGYFEAIIPFAIGGVLVCPKVYRKFKNKVIVIIGIILCLLIGIGTFMVYQEEEECIDTVKNGYLEAYDNEQIGDAFERFFTKISWEYFESEDGDDVVEFNGNYVNNQGTKNVKIQFVVEGEDFYIFYVGINGRTQSDYDIFALLDDVYN